MLGFILKGVLFHQAALNAGMRLEIATKYSQAQSVAKRHGKPLLVVGGPFGTNILRQMFRFKAHGCGEF